MQRLFLAVMLFITLALRAVAGDGPRPISIDPVPALGDTINQGFPIDGVANTPAVMSMPFSPPVSGPGGAMGGGPAPGPISLESIPALSDTINGGISPLGPAGAAARRSTAPVLASPAGLPGPAPELPPLPGEPSKSKPPVAPPPDPAVTPASASVTEPTRVSAASAPSIRDRSVPDQTDIRSRIDSGQVIGLTVASVGEELISLTELQDAMREWVRLNVPQGQSFPHEQLNDLAGHILEQLIDRAVFVQEAKHVLLKNEKQRNMFNEFVDKQWKDEEVPRLIKRYNAKTEPELSQLLEEQGRSLELMRANYRKDAMAREFLHHQLQGRMTRPEVRELWNYYAEHVRSFDRPAQVNWRELVVKIELGQDRATCRRRAEELLGRLSRGEDFATLAKTASRGPTASKGGLWQTEPGASAWPAVNQALETLPIGQISTLLEAPDGFHIVRVESRRAAGPEPFSEAQNKVREAIQDIQFQHEAEVYTQHLRSRTLITYYIQKPPPSRDAQAKRSSSTQ